MIVSGFALYVLLQTSNGEEEYIPEVFSDVKSCEVLERKYMKRPDYIESDCFYTPAIKVNKTHK